MGGSCFSLKAFGALLLLLMAGGCAFIRPVGSLPQEQRDALGRLGVAAAHFAPELDVDFTRGYGRDAPSEGGTGVPRLEGTGSRTPYRVLQRIVLAAADGGGYGIVAVDSDREAEKAENPVNELLHGAEFQGMLRRNVVEVVSLWTSVEVANADLRGSESPSRPRDFRDEEGIETVLEVGIRRIRFRDKKGGNSGVRLKLKGFARLLRVADGRILLEREYEYLSANRELARWEEEGAALVSSDLSAGIRQIAESIVDDCFLTSPRLKPPMASLAAVAPEPEFCFFCMDHIEPLSTLRPELCWQPFPAAEDLTGNREWLREAEEIVYDLRVWDPVERRFIPFYDLGEPCCLLDLPLAPCRVYWWAVRARFRIGEKMQATPWFWNSSRKKFKTSCGVQ